MTRRRRIKKAKPSSTGTGIGHGHGGNTSDIPPIQEVDLSPEMFALMLAGQIQADTKAYRMGKVKILCSKDEYGYDLSIACTDRYPTWDEVAKARYELTPSEITMVMILPPPEEYINIHKFVFHLKQVDPDCIRTPIKEDGDAG